MCPTSILNFIPTIEDNNIFSSPHYNSSMFKKNAFMLNNGGTIYFDCDDNISEYKIIKGIDGEYHSINEMTYTNELEDIMAQKVLHLLKKKLYIIPKNKNTIFSNYGIKEQVKLLNQLSNYYLESKDEDDSIMQLFDNISYEKLSSNINILSSKVVNRKKVNIKASKLVHLYSFNNYKQIFMNWIYSNNLSSIISVIDEQVLKTYERKDTKDDFIYQSIKPYNKKESFGLVCKLADKQFIKVSFLSKDDFILTDHSFYYADIIKAVNKLFDICSSRLKVNSQENIGISLVRLEGDTYEFKHNIKDNKDTPEEFINNINRRNMASRRTLGSIYDKILRIINNASVSNSIFINELLQNANDVKYPKKTKHVFNLEEKGKSLIVSYNEIGFTKEDIRAITDIGESTKIHVVEAEAKDVGIGEKGIGFKSVFKVANSVDIHSGNYHFKLTRKAPTIPEWISNQKEQNGTKIVLHLDKPMKFKYDNKQLINLVLGLTNIDEFSFLDKNIVVEKTDYQRNYLIDDEIFEYYVVKNEETVEEGILNQRRLNKPNESSEQEVELIFPKDMKAKQQGIIYCALPTSVETSCPFSINARFELNTSREGIVENAWNDEIICIVSLSIFKAYEVLKNLIGIDVLKYLTLGPIVKDNKIKISDCYNYLESRLKKKKMLMNLEGKWISFDKSIVVDPLEIDVLNAYNEEIDSNYVVSSMIAKYNCKHILKKLRVTFHTDKELFEELIENRYIQDDLLLENSKIRNNLFKLVNKYPDKEELFDYFYHYPLVPYTNEDCTVSFIDINDDIYYCDDKENPVYSEYGLYYILDTSLLPIKSYDLIVTEYEEFRIQKFGKEEFEKYQGKRIKKWLKNIDDLEERAKKILNEFNKSKEMMIRAFKTFDSSIKQKIVYKMQDGSYKEGKYKLYRYEHTDTEFDQVLISDDYNELAEALGIPYFLDIDNSDQYPFDFIESNETLEVLFSFNFNYKYSLYYSLIDNFKIDDDVLSDNLLKIVQNAGGLNVDILENCYINNAKILPNDDFNLIEKISVHCNNIHFVYSMNLSYKQDSSLIPIIEEIVYDIDSSTKIDYEFKKIIKSWVSKNNIFISNLRQNLICQIGEKKIILLNRNIKTDKQVYDVLNSFLQRNFKYNLTFNKTMNRYDRRLIKRIGNNKFTIDEAIELSKILPRTFLTVEDEKRLLCEPYEYKKIVYGGYAKRCPCCGARVHTELTGFRIAKLRQTYILSEHSANVLIDVPCCQNCFDAFSYADSYKINVDSLLYLGEMDISVKLGSEIWRPNKFKLRLAHMALVISMNDDLYYYLT